MGFLCFQGFRFTGFGLWASGIFSLETLCNGSGFVSFRVAQGRHQ